MWSHGKNPIRKYMFGERLGLFPKLCKIIQTKGFRPHKSLGAEQGFDDLYLDYYLAIVAYLNKLTTSTSLRLQ
jgi:hypothetical protein